MSFPATDVRDRIARGIAALPDMQLQADEAGLADALTRYLAELARWNKAYNLTAVRDPAEMVSRHVLDSLTVLPFVHAGPVLDVGTGAGLPGIPLALCRPQVEFVLLDSNGKKVRFLQHVVAELGLGNVTPVQSRVEQYEPGQSFAQIVCRAYTSLADFVHSSGRLVYPGGQLIAMKGRFPDEELAALPNDWKALAVEQVHVPGLDAERHVVILGTDPEN